MLKIQYSEISSDKNLYSSSDEEVKETGNLFDRIQKGMKRQDDQMKKQNQIVNDVLNKKNGYALEEKPIGFIFDDNIHKNGITIESPPKESNKFVENSPDMAKIWHEFLGQKPESTKSLQITVIEPKPMTLQEKPVGYQQPVSLKESCMFDPADPKYIFKDKRPS